MHTISTKKITISQILRERAELHPEKVAYTFLKDGESAEDKITYSELNKAALYIAQELRKHCRKGDRVILFFPPGLDFIKAFFGCLYAGVIAVPSYPPKKNRYNEKLTLMYSDCQPEAILTALGAGFDKAIESINIRRIPVVYSDQIEGKDWIKDSCDVSSEAIAFIQYTSGSTSNPKGVMVSNGNLMHNESLIQKNFGLSKDSTIVGWLPFYHDMCLIGNLLQAMYSGCEFIFMTPIHFLQKPSRWLRAISKYGATLSGGPNFSYDLCINNIGVDEIQGICLDSWKTAFNGAELIKKNTLADFYKKFKEVGFSYNAFLPCYGMAETTLFVSGIDLVKPPTAKEFKLKDLQYFSEGFNHDEENGIIELVSCGTFEGYNLAIVNEKGEECKPGTVGEVWLQGDSVAQGYWNNKIKTEETFGGNLINHTGHFLKTGDLGVLVDNELYISGRIKDLIIINGLNYYPQDIELIVAKADKNIVNNSVAAIGVEIDQKEELVVLAEVEYTKSTDLLTINKSIQKSLSIEFELAPHDIIFIRKGTIPKTTSGKIQRQVCKNNYLNGVLKRISQLDFNKKDSNTIINTDYSIKESEIYNLLKIQYKDIKVDKDTDLFSLGLDSIQLTRFVYALEDYFKLKITVDFLFEQNTIKKIADNIDNLTQEQLLIPKQCSEEGLATGLQELIWFNQQRNPENTGYNIPVILDFECEFNSEVINKTIDYLIEKHPVYRTSFQFREGKLYQKVNVLNKYSINIRDLSHFTEIELISEFNKCIKQEATQLFDLKNDLLFKVVAIKKSKSNFSLLFVIHHIIVDGASISMFLEEFKDVFQLMNTKGEISSFRNKVSFIDFANYATSFEKSEDMRAKKAFWQKLFSQEVTPISLPFKYSNDLKLNREGASYYFELDNAIFSELSKRISNSNNNQYSYLLSAYFLLIHRLTGSTDINIGAPVSLRSYNEFKSLHGLLINTSILRVSLDEPFTVQQFVNHVYKHTREVLKHSDYPFNQLVRDLGITNNENQIAITSIFFNYLDFAADYQIDDVFNSYKANTGVDINFDLNLYALPSKGGIKFRLDYCKHHVNIESIKILCKLYTQLIDIIVKDQHKSIASINVTIPEIPNRVKPSNDFIPFCEKDIQISIPDRFEMIVQQYSQKVAIKTDTDEITYQNLDLLSNVIANQINTNDKLEDVYGIGLLFGHDVNMISSILGVLKTGNYYVPLDNEYPFSRLQFIIDDASVKHILTNNQYYKKALELSISSENISVINIDKETSKASTYIDRQISSDSLAYVLYTSGSTGNPKGVMQTHEYVMHLTHSFTNSLHISKEDCFTLIPSFNFSASVMDLFGALLNGASLYVSHLKKVGVNGLLEGMGKHGVTVYHSVPTVFRAVCDELANRKERDMVTKSIVSNDSKVRKEVVAVRSSGKSFESKFNHSILPLLRMIYLAGESLLKNDVELYKDLFSDDVILVNGLGCTEFNICRQYFMDKNTYVRTGVVPIGYKSIGADVLIVDENRNILNNYQPGEIAIRSKYLSKGYKNNLELTESKFDVIDAESNERIYYTGDLGQKLVDGCLIHLGRKDFQVKLRGQRIELGEIESEILTDERIKSTICKINDIQGEQHICAFFIANEKITDNDITERLRNSLPDYMIPNFFIQMESFPLTDTGKVNRKLLPIPEKKVGNLEFELPSNEEKELSQIWSLLLNVKTNNISSNSSFFELGGHSLKAIQMISKIQESFNVKLTLRDVFLYPSLKSMVTRINELDSNSYVKIKKAPRKDNYSLSTGQKRLYILHHLNKDSLAYNLTYSISIKGEISLIHIQETVQKLVDRHDVFRTHFEIVDGEPVQVVISNQEINISHITIKENEDVENKIGKIIKPFDLSKSPLIQVSLLSLHENDNEHILLFNVHHIVCDGFSLNILVKDFIGLYKKENPQPPELQYVDYCEWQSSFIDTNSYQKQADYWKGLFKDNIPIIDLPVDFQRPPKKSYQGDTIHFTINSSELKKIKEISSSTGLTLYMILLGAFNILLSKICNQDDIIIGTPVAGRKRSDFEKIVGVFINTVCLRNYTGRDLLLREFFNELKIKTIESFNNQDYAFEDLIELLNVERDSSRDTLVNVMFLLHNFDISEIDLPDIQVSKLEYKNKTSKVDLSLEGIESVEGLKMCFEYSTDIFRRETIDRFVNYYLKIINQITNDENLEKKISSIEAVDDLEKQKILNEFNNSTQEEFTSKSVIDLFEEQVKLNPDSVAVKCNDKSLTYNELSNSIYNTANYLKHVVNKSEAVIGVYLDRSLEMIVTLLGILKTGYTYVPLDPIFPIERIRQIVSEVDFSAIITTNLLNGNISDIEDLEFISVEKIKTYEDSEKKHKRIDGDSLAYIIFTSGSTGKPKGVKINHNSLTNFLLSMQKSSGCDHLDKLLAVTTISFDISALELFLPLISGAQVSIATSDQLKDPKRLKDEIGKGITVLQATPSLWGMLVNSDWEPNFKLKALCGGEALSKDLASKICDKNLDLWNLYGPTETTIWSTLYHVNNNELDHGRFVTIGKPIENTYIYIVNENMQLQPIGVPGEICIGGIGLSSGYLNNEKLTKEKFTPDPYNKSKLLYKTGDIGKWLPNGNIEFLGRNDNQIKLRGFRIELSEIEGELLKLSEIDLCAVILKGDGNDSFICAYLVVNSELRKEEIVAQLSERLPEYMIPTNFMFLTELPMTSNGKVDRKKLPDLKREKVARQEKPENSTEEKLLRIWSDVLKVKDDEIGVNDSFFDVGGHSLRALNIVTKIQSEFGLSMTLHEIFNHSTIKSLGKRIQTLGNNRNKVELTIQPSERKDYYQPTPDQKRIYLLQKSDENSIAYNTPSIFQIVGDIDINTIQNLFDQLIKRYEALRSSFVIVNKELVIKTLKKVNFKIEEIFVQDMKDGVDNFIRPFNFNEDQLLIRVGLIASKSSEKKLLVIDVHHIVSDAISQLNLLKFFLQMYDGKDIPENAFQFSDYAEYHAKMRKSKAYQSKREYWLDRFKGEIPLLKMPLDNKRPPQKSFNGDVLCVKLEETSKRKIETFISNNEVTLFSFLLSIFNVLLYKYTGQQDIIIGSVASGRNMHEFSSIYGLLMKTLVIRSFPDPEKKMNDFVNEVNSDVVNTIENQDYLYSDLLKEVNYCDHPNRNPLFDVILVVQNYDLPSVNTDKFHFEPFQGKYKRMSKVDLSIIVNSFSNTLTINFEYNTDLFLKETIERISGHFVNIIDQVIENFEGKIRDISKLDSNFSSSNELNVNLYDDYEPDHLQDNLKANFDF